MTVAGKSQCGSLVLFGCDTTACPCQTEAFTPNMNIASISQLLMLQKTSTMSMCTWYCTTSYCRPLQYTRDLINSIPIQGNISLKTFSSWPRPFGGSWKGKPKGIVDLQIHWVAGHVGFAPNTKADEEAKKAAQGDSSNTKFLPKSLRKFLPLSISAL